MEFPVPDINTCAVGYWNSITRTNVPVKIIGSNGENYAVESAGHVYVVPKRNISLEKKFNPPLVTTAPRPETPYLVALTSKEFADIARSRAIAPAWFSVLDELSRQSHSGTYTNEWFTLSIKAATDLLKYFNYSTAKNSAEIEASLPLGHSHAHLVCQLWEEKNRRDGVITNG